jgi:hypothetical protein
MGVGRRLATSPAPQDGLRGHIQEAQGSCCNAPQQKARLASTELLSLQRSDVVEIVSGPGVISSDDCGRIHIVYRELDTAPVFQSHPNLVSCTDLRSDWRWSRWRERDAVHTRAPGHGDGRHRQGAHESNPADG